MIVAALAFVAVSSPALGAGVQHFQGSFSEAQEKARIDKKPIFIDFFTEW